MFVKIKDKMEQITKIGETKDMIQVGRKKWINKAYVVDKDGVHVFQSHVASLIRKKATDDYFKARKPVITKNEIMKAKMALGLV